MVSHRFAAAFAQPSGRHTTPVVRVDAQPSRERNTRNAQCPHCLKSNTRRQGFGNIWCFTCKVEVSSTVLHEWASRSKAQRIFPVPISDSQRGLSASVSGSLGDDVASGGTTTGL